LIDPLTESSLISEFCGGFCFFISSSMALEKFRLMVGYLHGYGHQNLINSVIPTDKKPGP
jgi:hypothetical protein